MPKGSKSDPRIGGCYSADASRNHKIHQNHSFSICPLLRWSEIPAKTWKITKKAWPWQIDNSKKRRSFLLLTIVRCPQVSRSYARCKIINSPSHHTVGAKKVPHFSCFRKRHFSRFALTIGPKMPPEADSWRLRIPFNNRVRDPFWRPKKRSVLGT